MRAPVLGLRRATLGPRARSRLRPLVAMLLLASAIAALEPASGASPSNEVQLSVIEYHPFPDSTGDPFGFATPWRAGATKDWMGTYYDGYWFPTTAFDGLNLAVNLPDSSLGSFTDEYRERFETRLAGDAPVSLSIMGRANASALTAQVLVEPRVTIDGGRILLRVVVFEDDIPFAGSNGVANHRFVARAQLPEQEIRLVKDLTLGPFDFNLSIPKLPGGAPAWAPGRLGLVAYVQVDDPPAVPALAPREVLQAATYTFRQEGPTIQVSKSVLLEMYTATWCDACVFGDGAVDTLAEEHGVPSSVKLEGARYLRAPSFLALALAAPAALLALWVIVPRFGRGGEPK